MTKQDTIGTKEKRVENRVSSVRSAPLTWQFCSAKHIQKEVENKQLFREEDRHLWLLYRWQLIMYYLFSFRNPALAYCYLLFIYEGKTTLHNYVYVEHSSLCTLCFFISLVSVACIVGKICCIHFSASQTNQKSDAALDMLDWTTLTSASGARWRHVRRRLPSSGRRRSEGQSSSTLKPMEPDTGAWLGLGRMRGANKCL